MGIVPAETALPERNADVAAWDAVSEDARAVLCRMQEVFAGFTTHTDAQIGRLVDFLERLALLDNTVVVVMSDNGASGEGGAFGSENEYRYFLGLPDTLEENKAAIDLLGGPWTHNHYPAGWAQAGNTPLKMYKKFTFGGGIRAPLIVHWPAGIAAAGEIRHPFQHVIDIAPTVLDLAGVPAPTVFRGLEQLPLHGTSLAYSFAPPDDAASAGRETQYFEMGGQRGIYHQGWKAVTRHQSGDPYERDRWELYYLPDDYSETRDLAEAEPARLATLVALWWEEARRNGVLPLDDRAQARAFARDPETTARRRFVMLPGTRLLTPVSGPNFAMRSFEIEARGGAAPRRRGRRPLRLRPPGRRVRPLPAGRPALLRLQSCRTPHHPAHAGAAGEGPHAAGGLAGPRRRRRAVHAEGRRRGAGRRSICRWAFRRGSGS